MRKLGRIYQKYQLTKRSSYQPGTGHWNGLEKISGDIYILGKWQGLYGLLVIYIYMNFLSYWFTEWLKYIYIYHRISEKESAENKIISYLWECWCIISWAWEPHILLQMLHTKCVSSFPPPTSEKRETLFQRPIVRVLKNEQFPEIERTRGITNLI